MLASSNACSLPKRASPQQSVPEFIQCARLSFVKQSRRLYFRNDGPTFDPKCNHSRGIVRTVLVKLVHFERESKQCEFSRHMLTAPSNDFASRTGIFVLPMCAQQGLLEARKCHAVAPFWPRKRNRVQVPNAYARTR